MSARGSDIRITVAIASFRRPMQLAALIPLILDQFVSVGGHFGGSILQLLIVDNDPAGTAFPACEPYLPRDVQYVLESERGISAARNRALRESLSDDVLIFIDDDETPEPGWLLGLLRTWSDDGADVVSGPVVSVFDGDQDDWVSAGEFYDRTHRARTASGTRIRAAATNNLLIDMGFVRRTGIDFDPRFGLSGGEDTMFTRSLDRAGATMLWCADAVVIDHVPRERMSREYVLSRTYTMSNASNLVEILVRPRGAERGLWRVRVAAVGSVRIVSGLARIGLGALTGSMREHSLGHRMVARGRGAIAASRGLTTTTYG